MVTIEADLEQYTFSSIKNDLTAITLNFKILFLSQGLWRHSSVAGHLPHTHEALNPTPTTSGGEKCISLRLCKVDDQNTGKENKYVFLLLVNLDFLLIKKNLLFSSLAQNKLQELIFM